MYQCGCIVFVHSVMSAVAESKSVQAFHFSEKAGRGAQSPDRNGNTEIPAFGQQQLQIKSMSFIFQW